MLKTLIVLNYLQSIQSARIFGYFFIPSVSHQACFRPILTALAEKGHDVTVFTANPLNNSVNGLTELSLESSYEYDRYNSYRNALKKESSLYEIILKIYDWTIGIAEFQFQSEIVQNFIKDNSSQFDLILIENLNPVLYAWAEKFRAPIVGKFYENIYVLINDIPVTHICL